MKNENKYKAYLSYAGDNYSSRINADNLLALEKALLLHLEEVQKTLSSAWSATDKRTVREVYSDEDINTTAD